MFFFNLTGKLAYTSFCTKLRHPRKTASQVICNFNRANAYLIKDRRLIRIQIIIVLGSLGFGLNLFKQYCWTLVYNYVFLVWEIYYFNFFNPNEHRWTMSWMLCMFWFPDREIACIWCANLILNQSHIFNIFIGKLPGRTENGSDGDVAAGRVYLFRTMTK